MEIREKPKKSIEIFCCYARKDRSFVDDLTGHLSSLQRQGTITLWSDKDIQSGDEWETEIRSRLKTAAIILLFVSADFLRSDYCYGVEMQKALERHDQKEACVLPLIIRPCYWQNTPFGKLQALPRDAKPVRSWQDPDEAYLSITEGIKKVIDQLHFLKNLEEKMLQACQHGDHPMMVETYERLHHSPYARLITLPPDVRRQVETAQNQQKTILKMFREALASKNVQQIGKASELVIPWYLSLTDYEKKILPLTLQIARLSPDPANFWFLYQHLRSSSYKSVCTFTTQEQGLLRDAKAEVQTYVHGEKSSAKPLDQELSRLSRPTASHHQRTIRIAIAGSVLSGQTTYFASLLYELERWGDKNQEHIQIRCLTPEHKEYFMSPFVDKQLQEGTLPEGIIGESVQPLIYEIALSETVAAKEQAIQLALYHMAGEDCQTPTTMLFSGRHLLNMDGIILLVDPWGIPSLHAQFRFDDPDNYSFPFFPDIAPGFLNSFKGSSKNKLSHPPLLRWELSFLVGGIYFLSFPKQIADLTDLLTASIPIAVTLSKSDLLQNRLRQNYSFLAPPKHDYTATSGIQDMQTVDAEVKDLLRQFSYDLLLHTAEPLNTSFFAVSATGHEPIKDTDKYPAIDPLRSLDPLFWLLYQLHVIRAKDQM